MVALLHPQCGIYSQTCDESLGKQQWINTQLRHSWTIRCHPPNNKSLLKLHSRQFCRWSLNLLYNQRTAFHSKSDNEIKPHTIFKQADSSVERILHSILQKWQCSTQRVHGLIHYQFLRHHFTVSVASRSTEQW